MFIAKIKMSCHGHGHGCCHDGDHNNKDDSPEMGIEYSLYTKIDKENLTCLNEATDGSVKAIFKPWEERLNFDTVCAIFMFHVTFSRLTQANRNI